jgi:hypothetical protein
MNGITGMKDINKKTMIKLIGTMMATILALLIYAVITAFPVMLLWNYCLVPAIPILKLITFWQALGIKILFGLLFHVTQKTEIKNGSGV